MGVTSPDGGTFKAGGADAPGVTAPWPNLFIAGAPRSGTTSLYHHLRDHPGIYMAPKKEPHFFSDEADRGIWEDEDRLAKATERYLSRFEAGRDHPVRGEASTSTLWHPEAPRRIAERVPDARIVASLRDPVERSHSHFLNRTDGMDVDLSFADAVELELTEDPPYPYGNSVIVVPSLYGDQVARFLDAFDEDQLLILNFHRWTDDVRGTLRRICTFLDVDPAPVDDLDLTREHNRWGTPRGPVAAWLLDQDPIVDAARAILPDAWRYRIAEGLLKDDDKPTVEPETRARLRSVFDPQIEALEERTGRAFPELKGEAR